MSRNSVASEENCFEMVSYLRFKAGEDYTPDRERMKKILQKAIASELTELQRTCIIEYYLNGKKMREIAESLAVHPSTVTRHISRGKEKLRRIAKYY